MKIALFYPYNWLASWYSLGGYRETLDRMGHTVLDCKFPGNVPHNLDKARASLPTIDELNTCDCILNMFAEYTAAWLEPVYGLEQWQRLKIPVINRYDESMDRQDLQLERRFPDFERWGTHHSFPARQDADQHKGQWLVYGADTTKFHPDRPHNLKQYQLAFVGSLYPLRADYLTKLADHIGNDTTFTVGQAVVSDLSGIRPVESTHLLAANYRSVNLFFCLPPMSRLLVCKVFEVMACGTLVMFPRLWGEAERNLEAFKDGEEISYYKYGYFQDNARQIREMLADPDKVAGIAAAGCERVHAEYTLEQMLEHLLMYGGFTHEQAVPTLTMEARHRLGIGTDCGSKLPGLEVR